MKQLLAICILCVGLAACSGGQKQNGFSDETIELSTKPVVSAPLDNSDTITIVALGANMSEMKFDTKTIRVPANKNITIKLINQSTDATMPHNLVFIQAGKANVVGQAGLKHKDNAYVQPNDENVIAHSPLVQIAETKYFSFTTPSAGEYEFICSYPGHWGMMKGKFLTE